MFAKKPPGIFWGFLFSIIFNLFTYVIVPKFQVGDIIVTHLWEYGIIEKVEEHIIVGKDEVVHIYYAKMFKDEPNSSIFFYESALTKIND